MLRRRIDLVVAWGASALILAFVVPLCLLVATLAEDRGVAAARQEATAAATLVSTLTDQAALADAVQLLGGPAAHTTVLLPDGSTLGETGASDAAESSTDLLTDPDVARALHTGAAFTSPFDGGRQVLVPVDGQDGRSLVRTFVSQEVLRQGVVPAWVTIGTIGLVLFGLSLLGGRALSGRLAEPVSDVAAVARRLRAGDLEARAVPSGPDEVVELGTAMNQLADRIEELLLAEREAVADLSHRLRTPLTALRLDSDLVAEPAAAARLRQHVDQLQRAVDQVVADARRPVREQWHGRCDAASVIADRVGYWRPLAEDEGRLLDSSVVGPAQVRLAAPDLAEMVDTLVDNVFSHTPEGTPFGVHVELVPQGCVVRVSDTGPGLSTLQALAAAPEGSSIGRPGAAPVDLAVERGVSSVGSSGLGLDIVRRIARSGGGSVQLVEGSPGLTVEVHLPAAP